MTIITIESSDVKMIVRKAKKEDIDAIWEIFREVIKTGDTYVFPPDTQQGELKKYWTADYIDTYVVELEDRIVGTYILKPNQVGLGAHIANGSYMVHPIAQGKGIGKSMCEHSIEQAKLLGYVAMQFNIVVSTNEPAIKLWKQYGFKIIGTIPEAFDHQKLGFVDAHIMYKKL